MPWITDANGYTYWEPDEGYEQPVPTTPAPAETVPTTAPAPTEPAQEPGWYDQYGNWIPNITQGQEIPPPATAPAPSAPAPTTEKPDFTTPQTDTQREQELRDALAAAERNREQLINEGQDTSSFDQSVKDVESKVAVVDAYKEAGQPLPADAKAAILGPAAPFVDLNKGTVDLAGAVKAGVPDKELHKLGISQIEIVNVRKELRQAKQRQEVGKAVEKITQQDIKDFEATHTELPDGSWMKNSDLEAVKAESPAAYQLLIKKGYAAYMSEYDKAQASLKAYTNEKGEVYLDRALMQMSDEDAERLHLLYKDSDIEETRKFIAGAKRSWTEYYDKVKEMKESKDFGRQWLLAHEVEARQMTLAGEGGAYTMVEAERFLSEQREALKKSLASLPPVVKMPAEFATRLAVGAFVVAPLMNMQMAMALAGIPTAKNKAAYVKDLGKGMVDYFKTIPATVKADPAMSAELLGVFVLGPEGAAKLANWTRAKASPFYVPGEGTRFSFSTGKLATKVGDVAEALKVGKISEADIARAIAKAEDRFMKSEGKLAATAKIGKSNINVHIEPTPVSKGMGAALWHATPNVTPWKAERFTVEMPAGATEPAWFATLHAAPRFAMSSAEGTAATAPGLIMVYTKKGGITWYPAAVQKAKTLEQMKAKGFKYLGSGEAKAGAYGPIKEYSSRFENEALFPNGETIYRVKNLRSRVLGAGAGEFVTTVDGWVVPIYRFAEKGAKVPKVGIAKLAAIRVNSTIHSLRLMAERHKAGLVIPQAKAQKLQGAAGFGASAGYATVETLSRELDTIGRTAAAGMKGAARDKAYNAAVDRAMVKRLELILTANPRLDGIYQQDPETFERAYRETVNTELARADHYRPAPKKDAPREIDVPRDTETERRILQERIDRIAERERPVARPEPSPREPIRPVERPVKGRKEEREIRIERRIEIEQPPRLKIERPHRVTVERPPEIKIPRPPRPPEKKRPPRPPLPRDASDAERRKYISRSDGAIAWRQGEVGAKGQRKDVFHVIVDPYTERADHFIVVGRRPAGATMVRGPRSAYRSAQVLYGKTVSREVEHDVGLFDARLKPRSRNAVALSFHYDPSVSGTAARAPLSERAEQISKGHTTLGRSSKVFPLNR